MVTETRPFTILRCVDPVCGLVQHQLYEPVRRKRHPITGQELIVVRSYPDGNHPTADRDFGYLESRFEKFRR